MLRQWSGVGDGLWPQRACRKEQTNKQKTKVLKKTKSHDYPEQKQMTTTTSSAADMIAHTCVAVTAGSLMQFSTPHQDIWETRATYSAGFFYIVPCNIDQVRTSIPLSRRTVLTITVLSPREEHGTPFLLGTVISMSSYMLTSLIIYTGHGDI